MKCNSLLVYWYLYKETWKFSQGWHGRLILDFILRVLANIAILTIPVVIAQVFNTIQVDGIHGENVRSIIYSLMAIPVLTVIFWLIHAPARFIEQQLSYETKVQYRTWMLDEVLKMPLQWHNEQMSGDIYDKIEKGAQALYDFVRNLYKYIDTLIRLFVVYVIICFFSLHAIYIIPIGFIIIFTCIRLYDKTIIPGYKKYHAQENKISAKIFDSFTNITTIVILGIRKEVLKILRKEQSEPKPIVKKLSHLNEIKWFTTSILNELMLYGILISFILIEFHFTGEIKIGTLFLIHNYLQRVSRSFSNLTGEYGQMVLFCTWLTNAKLISDHFQPTQHEKKHDEKIKTLVLKNMVFRYPSSKNIITIPHLVLKEGSKIAFVGESGSGKSTLLKILKGLYEPDIYTLTVNEKTRTIETLKNRTALIPQEPEIFSGTIEHNITIGIRHTLATVRKFARMAAFDKVVQKLPQQYNSHINEKGVNLSGGEKQRLALSRGLLYGQGKDILLFDEPTSSVDPKNERLIYQNVMRLFKKKIIVSSIHKLNLLPMFDYIYYFENGTIVAEGTLKELLKNKKFFAYYKKHDELVARKEF